MPWWIIAAVIGVYAVSLVVVGWVVVTAPLVPASHARFREGAMLSADGFLLGEQESAGVRLRPPPRWKQQTSPTAFHDLAAVRLDDPLVDALLVHIERRAHGTAA